MYDRVITIKLDYSKVPSKSTVPTYACELHFVWFLSAVLFGLDIPNKRNKIFNQHGFSDFSQIFLITAKKILLFPKFWKLKGQLPSYFPSRYGYGCRPH